MKRAQTVALFLVVLLVAVLVGSMVAGLGGGGNAAAPSGRKTAADDAAPAQGVRVAGLKAGGVAGAARAGTQVLRDAGYDVVFYGNAGSVGGAGDSSAVIDRVGRPELAERVANALDVRRVRSEPDSTLYVDVTVVIGRDWRAPITTDDEAPGRS